MLTLFRRANRLMLSLLSVEFLLLLTVFVGLEHLRRSERLPTSGTLVDATVFALVTMLAIFAVGAYQGNALRSIPALVPRLLAGALAGAFALSLAHLLPNYAEVSASQLVVLAAVAAAVLIGARALGFRLHGLRQRLKPKVLVLGAGPGAVALWQACGDRHGVRLHRFLDPDGEPVLSTALPLDRVGSMPDDLSLLAQREHIEEIVVVLEDRRQKLPAQTLLQCRM